MLAKLYSKHIAPKKWSYRITPEELKSLNNTIIYSYDKEN